MRAKQALLENLRKSTFCRIQPSSLGGVGVFAVRNIPEGIDPFQTVHGENVSSIDISPMELKTLHPNVQKMVQDFFMRSPNGNYPISVDGLNSLSISYYLNHSSDPNVGMVDTGLCYYTFTTKRRIRVGEELTIDYYEHHDAQGSGFGLPIS